LTVEPWLGFDELDPVAVAAIEEAWDEAEAAA
jgi:hypothetical protein